MLVLMIVLNTVLRYLWDEMSPSEFVAVLQLVCIWQLARRN